eukprot:6206390-Pleurochrysis_carterae.AAC.2
MQSSVGCRADRQRRARAPPAAPRSGRLAPPVADASQRGKLSRERRGGEERLKTVVEGGRHLCREQNPAHVR